MKDNLFDLHKVEERMLWMPPHTAMETDIEAINEKRMAYPNRAPVLVLPRLMTHLWRKHLGKDTDVLMTITAGDHFWDKSPHKRVHSFHQISQSYCPTLAYCLFGPSQ